MDLALACRTGTVVAAGTPCEPSMRRQMCVSAGLTMGPLGPSSAGCARSRRRGLAHIRLARAPPLFARHVEYQIRVRAVSGGQVTLSLPTLTWLMISIKTL